MKKRKCVKCNKEIELPHIRVWEEEAKISRMLVFCNIKCMVRYYTTVEGFIIERVKKRG